jgi:hypothetical protein
MRNLVYVGIVLWISFGIVLFVRYFILSTQMMNHRVPKQGQFLFNSTNPADYTEVGRRYRQKAIRTGIALLAYAPTILIIFYWV